MTELISGFAQSHFGHSALDQMPDSSDQQWQQQYYNSHMPMLTGQWSHTHEPAMSGMQQLDLRMFQQDESSYMPPYSNDHAPIVTHSLGYCHDWPSDIDMGTPSTVDFPSGITERSQNTKPAPFGHLQLPRNTHSSAYSPQSSQSGISPREIPLKSPTPVHAEERPLFGRSHTAPEKMQHRSTASTGSTPGGKRVPTSDEEDEDYVPSEGPKTTRGRKRQRIPHTAVERRYRENLNAHLDKLRQAVPSLAARKTPGAPKGGEGGEGMKPSKCEILNGAIEHIGSLDRENATLKSEVKALRSRMTEMENWYRANAR